MLRWTVDPEHPDERTLAQAADLVRRGGVVVFPTDTLYGLAANPFDARAVERVFEAKQRPGREPLPIIVAALADADRLAVLTPIARRLAGVFWPGPVTLVLEDAGLVAAAVRGGARGIALRVPASAVARGLAARAGGAITSTSANRSGQPAPASAAEAERELGDRVDGILDGGPAPGGAPSTIVDARGEAPVLVRAGAVAYERILDAMERG
ncbi:MAG: hypothetical protein H6Q10_3353 [Acidobacteria bacterium]|nr:hypothetical protein [Acidobacteriota bacterium]